LSSSELPGAIISLVALCFPFLLFFTQAFSSTLAPILDAFGRDATFTGRASIWQRVTLSTVNPLFGAGFYNFWGTMAGKAIALDMDPDKINTFLPSGHNGYLDLYLDGGFVGLALLFALLIRSANRVLRTHPKDGFQRLRFAFLIVAIVGNLTESFFARPTPLWFTTILISIQYPLRKKRVGGHKVAWESGPVAGPGSPWSPTS
jgi:O-antigen ligase